MVCFFVYSRSNKFHIFVVFFFPCLPKIGPNTKLLDKDRNLFCFSRLKIIMIGGIFMLKYTTKWSVAMVFCYQNFLTYCEKNFWNSRLKAENLQKFWDHSTHFEFFFTSMPKVKSQTNFNYIVILTSKRKSKSNFWNKMMEITNYAFSQGLVFASIISDLSDLFVHIKLVITSYLSSRKKDRLTNYITHNYWPKC